MNIISKKKYLNVKPSNNSEITKPKKIVNKPEIIEQNINYNEFGYPTELSQKYNKIKPK